MKKGEGLILKAFALPVEYAVVTNLRVILISPSLALLFHNISAISARNATTIPTHITTYTPSILIRSMLFRVKAENKKQKTERRRFTRLLHPLLSQESTSLSYKMMLVMSAGAYPLCRKMTPFHVGQSNESELLLSEALRVQKLS